VTVNIFMVKFPEFLDRPSYIEIIDVCSEIHTKQKMQSKTVCTIFLTLQILVYKERAINPLKTKINLKYIYRFSSYRVVNTLRLSFKNQSVNDV
jgi:hypothetical protein